jgi:hypothetical protein
MTLVGTTAAPHRNGAGPPLANGADRSPPPPLVSGAETAAPGGHGAHRHVPVIVVPPTNDHPPLRQHGDELVERARALVEGTTRALVDIAQEIGVAKTTVSKWAREGNWPRPAGAPTRRPRKTAAPMTRRGRLTERLYRAFGSQLAGLERKTRKRTPTDEKDARTLAVLAKTFETLTALDRDDGAKNGAAEPADREQFNAELARRIRRWAEGRPPD